MTQKKLIRDCPVCGGTHGDVLYPVKFTLMEGLPLADHYDVVMCTQCGFAFADTASTQADYVEYYQMHSKYEDATTSTGSAQSLSGADRARLRILADHIAGLLPDRALRIADIGCANGGLLTVLQTLGYTDLTGIDPSPACVANTAANPGIHALLGSFSDLPAVDKPFDLVVLTGVIEHVRDIGDALRALDPVLSENGYVYVNVPDAARFNLMPGAPFQEFNLEHINYFSVRSLTNFMEMHGYEAVAVEPQPYDEISGEYSLALLGLFRRTRNRTAGTWVTDKEMRGEFDRYIAASRGAMNHLEQQLAEIFARHPRLILWGTGQLALKMLTLPVIDVAKITAFVDGNPINQGGKLLGKPILAPAEVKGMQEPILLMTTLHHQAILTTIREKLNLPNEVLTLTAF